MLKKYINLKLRIRKNKNYHEDSSWYSFTFLPLKPLKCALMRSLRSGFRNGCIQDPLRANALTVSFLSSLSLSLSPPHLQIVRIVEFTRPNSRHRSALLFPFSTCCVALTVVISSYIRGRRSYVRRIKQGRKTRALWGISWYHRMYNVITEVSNRRSSL